MTETLKARWAAACKAHAEASLVFMRAGSVETRLTYAQLDHASNQFAHHLLAAGITKGERALIFLNKSIFFVVAHLALQKIGALAVPLNPDFKPAEIKYYIEDATPRLVLTEPAQAQVVRTIDAALPLTVVDTRRPFQQIDFFSQQPHHRPDIKVSPDDPGLIIYTSGTTGNPKGAVLTQRNLVHDAANIIDIWAISPQDVLCHALPLFHVHGLCFALHTAFLAGARVKMLDRFDAAEVASCLARFDGPETCTVFMAVPAMYSRLVDHLKKSKKVDFSHMRLFTSGSAPLLVPAFEQIKRVLGHEPVEREGMTETGMNFSNPIDGLRKPGSIGRPLPGLEVRIVDPETRTDAAPGSVGELWLKSPSITPGYWCKPQETEDAFVEGWFRSGDLGYVDEDGYYYLTDRIKHIIISGGENISAKEVETVINRLDGVVESAVVGIPNEKWGEKVVAAVVKETEVDLSSADVKAHCKTYLHDWKCPKTVHFVDRLPRNTMGKVLKETLKAQFSQDLY